MKVQIRKKDILYILTKLAKIGIEDSDEEWQNFDSETRMEVRKLGMIARHILRPY